AESDEIRAAEAVLTSIDEDQLYSPIDQVRCHEGAPALMEIELIEPDLYLAFDPAEGRGFAAAVRERIAC
ncbi:MAG: transporter, partial [Alphaproteobacteria bacterium]|nr:transporter [Alphaproteobacteria bacterium]